MVEQIKKELADDEAVLRCAERFGLVGDPTRMKICWLLCHHKELSVGRIGDLLGISISTVSHSLKGLKEHSLVRMRREHKLLYYSLTNSRFNTFLRQQISTK